MSKTAIFEPNEMDKFTSATVYLRKIVSAFPQCVEVLAINEFIIIVFYSAIIFGKMFIYICSTK